MCLIWTYRGKPERQKSGLTQPPNQNHVLQCQVHPGPSSLEHFAARSICEEFRFLLLTLFLEVACLFLPSPATPPDSCVVTPLAFRRDLGRLGQRPRRNYRVLGFLYDQVQGAEVRSVNETSSDPAPHLLHPSFIQIFVFTHDDAISCLDAEPLVPQGCR